MRQILKEIKEEMALLDALKKAGENISASDIEQVEKSEDTTSYDIYINGEPHQFDIDKSGQVYYYDVNIAKELGFINNIPQLVSNYKKLKGI